MEPTQLPHGVKMWSLCVLGLYSGYSRRPKWCERCEAQTLGRLAWLAIMGRLCYGIAHTLAMFLEYFPGSCSLCYFKLYENTCSELSFNRPAFHHFPGPRPSNRPSPHFLPSPHQASGSLVFVVPPLLPPPLPLVKSCFAFRRRRFKSCAQSGSCGLPSEGCVGVDWCCFFPRGVSIGDSILMPCFVRALGSISTLNSIPGLSSVSVEDDWLVM
jgi:hypothetical protein